MKLDEIVTESLLDKIKSAVGNVKSKVVASIDSLLLLFKQHPTAKLTTIEDFEVMNTVVKARVDTGATVCSIHGDEIEVKDEKVIFKFEGKTVTKDLVEMKTVKSASGTTSRPRIKLDYKWNGKVYMGVITNVTDRKNLKFKLLIGRNLIEDLKLPVHVSKDEVEE